ncbi:MAG: circularly permuted type 2 ATP-grasp protein [Planctomycetales bacterium]|nr:circularly permuted type 2 ATP-grasp protein [Planctomycetales bacterium]
MSQQSSHFAAYQPVKQRYDEYVDIHGSVRHVWQPVRETLDALGAEGLQAASIEVDRLVRESGANFQAPRGRQFVGRPWQLAATPFVMDAAQWRLLQQGLQQRVRVLEAVVQDLLGAQRLFQERIIPASLLSANPFYSRAYHELPCLAKRLTLCATDLAKDQDGSWWVTGDRTRAPSGLGYALENRIITSRVFPKLIHSSNVCRLASFFVRLQSHFSSLARPCLENPHVAILTPGMDSYRYVEDAYLARYLGYTLVQGRDLAVRGNRLTLKTLAGLQPIDVLWRHVSDRKCDPLELEPTSMQGITGLLQTIRAGTVAVVNSIGASLAQMPALVPFLPAAARFLFGEELILPSLATYWCGGARERLYTLEHLEELSIRDAFSVSSKPPMQPREMSAAQVSQLVDRINKNPHLFIAQASPARSTTPVWHDGKMHAWHTALRCFQLQTESDVEIMPGGLVRVSPDALSLDHSPTSGRLGQDCWVVSDTPVDHEISLLPPLHAPLKLVRGGIALPSRVAENLYWLGRSAERAEAIARLLRCTLSRIVGETVSARLPDLPRLVAALAALGQIEPDYAIAEFEAILPALETQLPASVFDQDQAVGLRAGVTDMEEKAAAVHDRISLDAYRIITQVGKHLDYEQTIPDAGMTINRLDGIIGDLLAFSGVASESMTRTHGWRFLQLGRRIERAHQTAELLAATLVNPIQDERQLLESILQATDCLMTYRSRYLLQLQPEATIDLLVNDVSNPRSVAFQLIAINGLLEELPRDVSINHPVEEQHIARDLFQAVEASVPAQLATVSGKKLRSNLDSIVTQLINQLPKLSDAISARYLIHTAPSQELTGRLSGVTT